MCVDMLFKDKNGEINSKYIYRMSIISPCNLIQRNKACDTKVKNQFLVVAVQVVAISY